MTQSYHHRCNQLPFSESIQECGFPKKFTTANFECYFDQSDPVQHLRQYQDKMVIHATNDSILCQIFSSSLKEVASDWFYSFPLRSIHNFQGLTELFLAQYSSHQEFKQNNYYLLSVKIRPSDNLKANLEYFQNQLIKVHNYSKRHLRSRIHQRIAGHLSAANTWLNTTSTVGVRSCIELNHTSCWRKQ